MSRHQQYEAYAGSPVAAPLPEGDYLQVARYQNDVTKNQDLWSLWDAMSQSAQLIAHDPSALQPVVTKELVEVALRSIDNVFAQVAARITTRANRVFSDTYGGPNDYSYSPYPIRWAGENRLALTLVLKFVSALHQSIWVPSNRLDKGILDNHGWTILKPLFDGKVEIMELYFGLEVQGQIEADELDAMFRAAKNLTPPLPTSLSDEFDSAATAAAEDAAAMASGSAPIPDQASIEAALSGVEAWTWKPTPANWATFAEMLRRRELAGATQSPPEPFPFTTGTIGPAGSVAGSSTPSGLTTPS